MQTAYFYRRPDDEAAPLQPLLVRSIANRRFDSWEQEDFRLQDYHKIQWCVSGSAEVRILGKAYQVNADHVVHYPPNTEHWSRAGADGWHCCWITFGSGIPDAILAAFGLEGIGVFEASPCPVDDFAAVATALEDLGYRGDREAGILAYRLLAKAADSCRIHQRHSGVDRALNLLQEHWANPNFGIGELADRCRLHRSQLSRMFRDRLGVAPSRYLTRLRLQHAARMLLDGSRPSSQIAEVCGFNDSSYFARAFRKAYGVSPQDYRREGDR